MNGRQVLVEVAEVVLAELAGGVAEWLEHFGDGRVLLVQTHGRGRHANLAQARAKHVLAGDERRPPGCAALLRVVVGERHAFLGEAVNVGRAVAHQPLGEGTDVGLPDIITEDDENVWRLRLSANRACNESKNN